MKMDLLETRSDPETEFVPHTEPQKIQKLKEGRGVGQAQLLMPNPILWEAELRRAQAGDCRPAFGSL